MPQEFIARRGLISLSTSSFYGPVNFGTGSSIVGLATGSVLFTGGSGNITGSSNLFWDNTNGRLGIGTSSPAAALHVNGDATYRGTYPYFELVPSGWSGGKFYIQGGTDVLGQSAGSYTVLINTQSSRGFSFIMGSGAGSNKMVITPTNGNVLISNSTDAGYRLDINGSGATAGALRSTSGSVVFDVATGSLAVNNSGTSLLFVSSSGRVGVGTNTPTNMIEIKNNFNGQTRLDISNTTSGTLSFVGIQLTSDATAGVFSIFKYGTSNTGYKIIQQKDVGIYNSTTAGDMSFLNDYSLGQIKFTAGGASTAHTTLFPSANFAIGSTVDSNFRLQINPSGSLSGSLLISGSNTQPTIVGNSLTSVNIAPTMIYTTGSQTQTALKVLATFSGSSAFTSSQSNIIADFGATSVGSQLIVTDVTSGSIYMVNDVSGIPIIDADSNWSVNFYDYPYTVFKKTGSMLELGVQNQTSSYTLFKSDLIVNEGLGFYQRTSQVSGSTNGAVTSSLYSINFTNTSASVYLSAVVTGYDTGSRDTISGDIKATIRYRSGVASVVGYNQSFYNTDNSVVGFDIIAGGTSGSLVAYGTGSRVYQWGATVVTQII